jgi:hypothetical protein
MTQSLTARIVRDASTFLVCLLSLCITWVWDGTLPSYTSPDQSLQLLGVVLRLCLFSVMLLFHDPGLATTCWGTEQMKQQYPALREDTETDVAIVGGGISGLTTAYLLAKAGANQCWSCILWLYDCQFAL